MTPSQKQWMYQFSISIFISKQKMLNWKKSFYISNKSVSTLNCISFPPPNLQDEKINFLVKNVGDRRIFVFMIQNDRKNPLFVRTNALLELKLSKCEISYGSWDDATKKSFKKPIVKSLVKLQIENCGKNRSYSK